MNLQMNAPLVNNFPAELADQLITQPLPAADSIRDFCEAHGLHQKRLLIAFSGGKDSLFLACVMKNLCHVWQTEFALAYLNHQAQESNSIQQEFVQHFAMAAEIPLHSETLDSQLWKEGFQESQARQLRYQWLQQTAASHQMDAILTAHHQDDQVETLLFRLFRGTGFRGLNGIPQQRPLSEALSLYRPMLEIDSTQITEALSSRGIPHWEDPSNSNAQFTRNWIRHQLVPMLQSQPHFHFPESLLKFSHQAGEVQEYLQQQAEPILWEALETWGKFNLCGQSYDVKRQSIEQAGSVEEVVLDAQKLKPLPMVIRRELFVNLLEKLQWPQQQMSLAHWQKMAELIDEPGKRAEFPGKMTYLHRQKKIRLLHTSS